LGGQAGTHDDYYAINPRRVSGMVEKSKKNRFAIQSAAKYGRFWGIAFWSLNARERLSMTYVHRKRLPRWWSASTAR
jgi:hypothetical protein